MDTLAQNLLFTSACLATSSGRASTDRLFLGEHATGAPNEPAVKADESVSAFAGQELTALVTRSFAQLLSPSLSGDGLEPSSLLSGDGIFW